MKRRVTYFWSTNWKTSNPPANRSALGSMSQITIRRYSLSDFKLSALSANAALLHYTVSYQETETRRLESKGNEYGPDLASHAPHEDTAKAGRDSNYGNLCPAAPISAKFLLEPLL